MNQRRQFTIFVSILVIVSMLTSDVARAANPAIFLGQTEPEGPPIPTTLLPSWWTSDIAAREKTAALAAASCQQCQTPLPSFSDLWGESVEVGPHVSVNAGSGALRYDGIALAIPNRGPEFQVSLSYHSLYRESDAGWGYGWTFAPDRRYELIGGGDVMLLLGRNDLLFLSDGQGEFIPPFEGITLTQQSTDTLILTQWNGEQTYFESPLHKRATRLEDAGGEALAFGYDGAGQLETISNGQGREMAFSFTAGRLHTITDAGSVPPRWLQLDYGPTGDLITVTDALSQTTVLNYDAEHRLASVTDPRGGETVITYSGDYVTQAARDGVITTFGVDEQSNTVTIREQDTQKNVRERVYAYNYRGLPESVTYPDGTSISQSWDDVQNQYSTSDENGHTTVMLLDGEGRASATRDPLGRTTTYTYHPTLGHMTVMTDPNGYATTYEYDDAGMMSAVVDSLGHRSSYGYNDQGEMVALTDPLSHTTRLGYTENGTLTTITNPLGIATVMAYDAAGNLASTSNGNGYTTHFAYDALGRSTLITNPLGYTATMAYDENDNLVQASDANGYTATFAYDESNRPTVLTDALGGEVRLAYDAWGNPTVLTDALKHATRYTYDARDRLTSQTDPLSQTTFYRYDAAGNLLGMTDARGQTFTYTYDAANQLTRVDYPGEDDVYVFYNQAGQATVIGDADVDVEHTYDAAGRVTETIYAYDGVGFAPLELAYVYDAANRRTGTTLPGGETVSYEYDVAGRLTALTGDGTRHEMSYDDGDRLTQITPAAGQPGARVSIDYDAADQITTLSNASPDEAVTFDSFSYGYDRAGNVLTATHNGETTNYAYDAVYRLTDVAYPDASWEHHTYDAVGNRLQMDTLSGTVSYVYDVADQLLSLTDTRSGLPVATTFAYDENGNLRTRTSGADTTTYTWDAGDRLVRVDLPDGTYVAYTYGPQGRRLSRQGRDGETVYYVYDGQNLVEERDADGDVLASYVHGATLDRPYSMQRDGQTYYYLYDRQGSVVGLTDGGGNLVAQYEYDAWGNLLDESGTVENPFRYTGREWDAEVGLYYNRARYYDPTLGRFLSRDPLGPVDGTNRYVYVANNPVNYTDSQGTNRDKDEPPCDGACKCFHECFEPFFENNLYKIIAFIGFIVAVAEYYVLGTLRYLIGAMIESINLLKTWNQDYWNDPDCAYAVKLLIIKLGSLAFSVASGIPLVIGACASTVTGVGAILCGGAIAFLVATVLYADAAVIKAGMCWYSAQECKDTEDPHIVNKGRQDNDPCGEFYRYYDIEAWDNCQLVEPEIKESGIVASWGSPEFSYPYDVRARDAEGNTAHVRIPACNPKDNKHCARCPNKSCYDKEWNEDTCEWECIPLPQPEAPDCDKCKYPKWDPDLCVWRCLPFPCWHKFGCEEECVDCGRDKCGNYIEPVQYPLAGTWTCPDTNNPCNPDDNRSPAGLESLTRADLAKGSAFDARIAILGNGHFFSLQGLLGLQGVSTELAPIDFSPEMVDRYPVLFIPSGGLSGYVGSSLMQQRLEQYAQNGGVIVAFTQEYGDEFRLLPGGEIRGYGYDEDLNCHADSAYVSAFAPMLLGQSREVLSLNIDGFFTHWPDDTVVLLGRVVNGMPAMLSYPYGAGRVVATTAYADMAHYQGQGTHEEQILLRDLARWALAPSLEVDSYAPHDVITAPLTLTNETASPLTHLHYDLLDPWGQLAASEALTLSAPLDPGASTSITLALDLDALALPEDDRYGLWTIDGTLSDGAGSVLQEIPDAYHFAVTHFTEQGDGHGYQGQPYAMSITSETEEYPYFLPATFTYHVFNHSDQEETFKVHWWFAHHQGWPNTEGTETITVSAHSTGVFTTVLEHVRSVDRLRARLRLNGQSAAYAERGFWVVRASLSQDVTTDEEEYNWGESPVATITSTNLLQVPFQMSAHLETQSPDGQTVLADVRTFTVVTQTPHVYTVTLPPLTQAGFTEVSVENQIQGHYAPRSSTRVYLASLALDVTLDPPARVAAGAPLTLTVANAGVGVSSASTLQVRVVDPSGATVWLDQDTLPALMSGQTSTQTFSLGDPGSIAMGDYVLAYRLVSAGELLSEGEFTLPSRSVLESDFDRGFYRIRDTVQFAAVLRNTGHFDLSPLVTITVPVLGLTTTQPVTLPVGAETRVPFSFSLPSDLAAGAYKVEVVAEQGETVGRSFAFVVPPANPGASIAPGSYRAGDALALMLTNEGGVDATFAYTQTLVDVTGHPLAQQEGATISIQAGQTVSTSIVIPVDAVEGYYILRWKGHTDDPARTWKLWDRVKIDGVAATLSAMTDQGAYLQPDPITATANIDTTGTPLSDANLSLQILKSHARPEYRWTTHRVGDHSPLNNGIWSIAIGEMGLKWVGTADGVSVLDDGGTLFDKSDDTWQFFTTADGLVDNSVNDIITDAAGLEWFGTTDGVSVLDDGSTPFDKSDDTWQSFSTANGLVNNGVSGIIMDGTDLKWFGTNNGVSVLDDGGTPFDTSDDAWQSFSTADGLVHSRILDIAIDQAGLKWFGTLGGVSVLDDGGTPFNTSDDVWESYTTAEGLIYNRVYAVAIEGTGIKWFGTLSGVSALDDGGTPLDNSDDTWQSFSTANGLTDSFVRAISVDEVGLKWFGTYNGMNVLDDNATPFDTSDDTWQSFTTADGMIDARIGDVIVIDEMGYKWFSTAWGGVGVLDDDETPFDKVDDVWQFFRTADGLVDNEIYAITADVNDLLWFGTAAGVSVLDDGGTPSGKSDDTWQSFASSYVYVVAIDEAGLKWLGTAYGASVLDDGGTPFDESDDTRQSFDTGDGLIDDSINAIAIDEAGMKWFATNEGVSVLDDGGTPLDKTDDVWQSITDGEWWGGNNVRTIAIDEAGLKWFGIGYRISVLDDGGTPFITEDDDWEIFELEEGYFARVIAIDEAGLKWFGIVWDVEMGTPEPGGPEGVGVLDDGDTPFDHSDNILMFFDDDPTSDIMSIARDEEGLRWFGTDYGVSVLDDGGTPFDEADDTWQFLVNGGDWKSDYVTSIVIDGAGQKWFGTWNGITALDTVFQMLVWSGDSMLDLPTSTQVITSAGTLNDVGKFYLQAILTSTTGQPIARDTFPFYVFPAGVELTMETDRPIYRPGQTILVSGRVTNTAALSDTISLTVTVDGQTLLARALTLASGEGTRYTATLTATQDILLVATTGSFQIDEQVNVAAPQVEATLISPQVVSQDPFSPTLIVTNTGIVSVSLVADFGGHVTRAATLESGEVTLLQASLAITEDTLLTVTISGDVSLDLTQAITYGKAVSLALGTPPDAVWAGPNVLPYTLNNTGLLPSTVPLTFTLDGMQVLTRQVTILPGQVFSAELWLELLPGARYLTATMPGQQKEVTWTAYDPNEASIRIDGFQAPARLVGQAPVTATLTNPTPGRVDGTLRTETPFYLIETPFSLGSGDTQAVTATLNSGGAPAGGTFTLTVSVWTNGDLLGQIERSLDIPRPSWQVDVPEMTVVPGVATTIPVTVHNTGGLGAPFTLTLDLHGLYTADEYGWADPGEVIALIYTFTLPSDVEARTAVGHYRINDVSTPISYTIAGYQLDMSGHLSPRVAAAGQMVSATVRLTDTSGLGQPLPLGVRLAGIGDPQMATITLTNSAEVNFALTAPEQDTLLSYGLYHPDGRSLLLDTLRLYVPGESVALYPDQGRYLPGDTATFSVQAQVSGTLTWQAFGISETLALAPGLPVALTVSLPDDLLADTHYLWYLFEASEWEWEQGEVAFEVAGDHVEVRQVTLDHDQLGDRDIVSATLRLGSSSALNDLTITGRIVAPDGMELVSQTTTVDLPDGINWVSLPPLDFDLDQAGSYRLSYHLAQGGREMASGWQIFDVAGPVVLGVHVPQAIYLPTEPVTISVALLNEGTPPVTLVVALDGQPVAERTIVDTGYQVETVDLGPLSAGEHTLSAHLTDSAARTGQGTAQVQVVLLGLQVQIPEPDGLAGWHTVTPTVGLWPDVEGSTPYYRWNGGLVQAAMENRAEVPASDGQYDLEAWAELSDGRASPVVTTMLKIDRATPVVAAVVESGKPVTVSLTASDDTSGVGWIGYLKDDGWLTYTHPLTFESVYTTSLLYRASDEAGNVSPPVAVTVPPVEQAYGLMLEADTYSQIGAPGATVVYRLRLTNTGAAADVYTVTVLGENWPAQGPIQVGPLNAGWSADLVVVVDIPLGVMAEAGDVATLTVTSMGDPVQFEQRSLTTVANILYGVAIKAERTARTGVPGGRVSYWVQVINLGNMVDTFDVAVTDNVWPTTAPLVVGPFVSGASENLKVTVAVPTEATAGQQDVAAITATSQAAPVQSAGVRLTTTIPCLAVSGAGFSYWPLTPRVGETLQFSGTALAGTPPFGYTWDFGDGHTGGGREITHTYAASMTYRVLITATNCVGAYQAIHQQYVIVSSTNVAPTVDAGPDQTVNVGDKVLFAGSFIDPDTGDTHTIEWNFGDGGSVTGTLTPTHIYTEEDVYVVTLVVTDSQGMAGSDTLLVTVRSEPPCPVEQVLQDRSQDTVSYRDLRDEVLVLDTVGQGYVALYEKHVSEVTRILISNPRLARQAATLLQQWKPAVDELVAAQRDAFVSSPATQYTVTREDVEAARTLLDALSRRGSSALRLDIQLVSVQLDSFEGHTPPEIWETLTQVEILLLPVLMKDYTNVVTGP